VKLEIKVTAKNIDRGEPGSAYCCPIALALEDLGYRQPCVLPEEGKASVWKDSARYVFYLPRRAVKLARDFDRKGVVKPARFILDGDVS
jgi:hypothetical protein